MTQQTTEIEVEVLEIDGMTPVAAPQRTPDPTGARRDWQDWRHWQTRVKRLDSRWWPLWLFLGLILVVLFLTVGLVVGVVFLIMRLLMNAFRALTR